MIAIRKTKPKVAPINRWKNLSLFTKLSNLSEFFFFLKLIQPLINRICIHKSTYFSYYLFNMTKVCQKLLAKFLSLFRKILCLPGTICINTIDNTSKAYKENKQIKKRKNKYDIPLLFIVIPDLGKWFQKTNRWKEIKESHYKIH